MSHTSRPMAACAGYPNSAVAVSDQEITRPCGLRLNVARPDRSGSRRRGSTGWVADPPGGSLLAAITRSLRYRANTKCTASTNKIRVMLGHSLAVDPGRVGRLRCGVRGGGKGGRL